jgi:metal-responsive CopG/Arc/MetJ family transcriptional regulator
MKGIKMKKRNKKHGITQISISFPKEMLPKLDELARRQMRNRSNYITTLIKERIESKEL